MLSTYIDDDVLLPLFLLLQTHASEAVWARRWHRPGGQRGYIVLYVQYTMMMMMLMMMMF